MPHFVLDCSSNIIQQQPPEKIMQIVYEAANATGLFAPEDIKVRINPFQYYTVGNQQKDFIHVFGNIMEGRNKQQKAHLSKQIILALKPLFPTIPILSINIRDFEKATYCNKTMV
ncbi:MULTISPECIES: 5-carboxymethyl-2-hydroxymuconate Delta-isomerase [unclassified Aureispira]|uniref:5-carboxymethyl-2-hydroxymuconate Delta-isomerase n=1 Tax=unclassified Aureispira TaxID=2649989 RepID=UPI000695BFB3|nr:MULTISPECIES: 5-carboxymethyl-2-hydroxymuconate Delta-isomerase [unclassified Aureispira]WMX16212.1 5-carboxymethyl-2-hydroxymuconate Delta-isomerase [Aureispira sp. CCB-E]